MSLSTLTNITLALLVGKSDFFLPIIRGFEDACAKATTTTTTAQTNGVVLVNCHVRRYVGKCPTQRIDNLHLILQELPDLDGVAMNTKCADDAFIDYLVYNYSTTTIGSSSSEEPPPSSPPPPKQRSLVTYDKDLPERSGRVAYIGTDDVFMGQSVARLVRGLRPQGGTYAVVGSKPPRTQAFVQEMEKYNAIPGRAHWTLVDGQDEIVDLDTDTYAAALDAAASLNPTALVTLTQAPMRVANWTDILDLHAHRNITYVGVDAADYQLDYLQRQYVHGLVGQMQYQMGVECFHALARDVRQKRALPLSPHVVAAAAATTPQSSSTRIKTNLVSYNIIPLELPPLKVEEHLLESLAWLGYTFFGIIAAACLTATVWTVRQRNSSVVIRAAQPEFLVMICAGVLLLSASLIPLSMDDGGAAANNPPLTDTQRVAICMTTPWCAFTGFTVIFSALFAKTWRVNRIVQQQQQQTARTRRRDPASSSNAVSSGTTSHSLGSSNSNVATVRDVLAPFAALLTCNWAILLAWTLWDPLEYTRWENEGTDYWNRVLATHGGCRSDHAAWFLVPLGVLNFAGVVMSCWQAIRTRNVKSEFSESFYIGLTVASLCQGFLTGIPVVVVVREMPRVYYVVLSLTIFLLCMAVLGLIFIPKILMQQKYRGKSKEEQTIMIRQGILRNQCSSQNQPPNTMSDMTGTVERRHANIVASSSDDPMSSSDCGYRSEVRRHPSSEEEDEDSSNFAYRSDHARGNDLTTMSIPEERILEGEEEEEEDEDQVERVEEAGETKLDEEMKTNEAAELRWDDHGSPSTTTTVSATEDQPHSEE